MCEGLFHPSGLCGVWWVGFWKLECGHFEDYKVLIEASW